MSSPRDPEAILQGRDISAILRLWEEKYSASGSDPTPIVNRLADIFKESTEAYLPKNPDPFDERHPSRVDPECELGKNLKALFRKDNFITKLVSDYLRENFFTRQNINKSSLELNMLSCRLILVIIPGLETTAVFNPDSHNLINRIYSWAEDSIEPLQSYATGLLGIAMEVSEIAVAFQDSNLRLVPKMIKRLHMLQVLYKSRDKDLPLLNDNKNLNSVDNNSSSSTGGIFSSLRNSISNNLTYIDENAIAASPLNNVTADADENSVHNVNISDFPSTSNLSMLLENENSLDATSQKNLLKFIIPIYPPTTETCQMFILRYLTSMGEYQEFLGFIFEYNVIQLIFGYIQNVDARDTCLAFEALKYLSSLLCHKKFALEFISRGGIELLLKVPRSSLASTGVAVTFYYLAYCEDAMERICSVSKKLVSSLISYALWLLSSKHDSAICHAIMFFGLSFQFKVVLDEFDNQNGLRKIYNVISILPILSSDDDDVETAYRQLVRHVCVALKKYMESHLFFKYHYLMRQQCSSSTEQTQQQPILKAAKSTLDQLSDQIRYIQENTPSRMHWAPVDQFLKLEGIPLLLRIISRSENLSSTNGRAETVRSALDVISVCCISPKTAMVLCENMENSSQKGISEIVRAANGDVSKDPEVIKSALSVLIHTLCAPLTRPSVVSRYGSTTARKRIAGRLTEELNEKVWDSACSTNVIFVLIQLMETTSPITEADCIRGMACRALSGLARSERVRQIIGKLPLFTNGQIQTLMRDPILQEKRVEHVTFQKHALELLERVSGKSKSNVKQLDTSLANIHKANVIAQTRIQYNDQQLFQLIHDHLISKGLHESAQTLQKEAGLSTVPIYTKQFHHSPFTFRKEPQLHMRARMITKSQDLNTSSIQQLSDSLHDPELLPPQLNGNMNESCSDQSSFVNTPIKLKRKLNSSSTFNSSAINANSNIFQTNNHQHRSLEKQLSPDEPLIRSNLSTITEPKITLNTIVTEYLTSQHALCNNPMTTCPQFDLFSPHKCPDPKPNRVLGGGLDFNLTARLFKKQAGYNTMRLDRRYVHMNFSPVKIIRAQDYDEIHFRCCDYLTNNSLVVITNLEAKIFNLNDGNEENAIRWNWNDAPIDYVKASRDGNMLVMGNRFDRILSSSVLYSIDNRDFVQKFEIEDALYCEFNNLSIQDKLLATKDDSCSIYDINTGQSVATFEPKVSNNYFNNRATFCPSDELILSDGVLWDVRSGKEIHKFDKLNQNLSGVFHPNGLEIISNTEIWDLRTFHLLQTVTALDQCIIKFSPLNVIYGIRVEFTQARDEYDDENIIYGSSFKVLDSSDYSSISTINVKRQIYDLSINSHGSHIALVENTNSDNSNNESFVKVYAAGVKKNEEDEEDEEEELQSDENSESDSSQNPAIQYFRIGEDLARRRRRNRANQPNNGDADADADNDEWIDLPTSSSDNDDDDDEDIDDNNDDDDDGNNDNDDNNSNNSSEIEMMVEFYV